MLKRLLSSKWVKMVLAGTLAAAIAIVFFMYGEQKETTENADTKSIVEKVSNEEILPEETNFFEAAEALKQQANEEKPHFLVISNTYILVTA